MTSLITILISLLGYGTPADYTNHTEQELVNEIELAQEEEGGFGEWEE